MSDSKVPWSIVIADRGFVFAGRVTREADRIRIDDCYNIRRWSLETKDGIGGIAESGPRAATNDILDRWPVTRVHILSIVGECECPNQEAWESWHAKISKAKKR